MTADADTKPKVDAAPRASGQPLDDALNELRESAPHLGGLAGIGQTSQTSAVWQIELDLQVVLGSTTMAVSDLLELEAGGTITLDQDAAQPLELAVNGRTIGYGELVEDAAGGLAVHILSLHDHAAQRAASDAA